jgi:tetratricopeptide (TPR) repeat protein
LTSLFVLIYFEVGIDLKGGTIFTPFLKERHAFFAFIIITLLIISYPVISFADTDKTYKDNKKVAETHYYLGVAYGKSGKNKEAIEAFKQTIRFKPDYAEAQYGLGVAYGESGRYEEARKAFKQVIRFKPDYAEAHYNLGVVYVTLKERGSDLDNAIVEMEKAVDLSPESVRFNMELGRLYFSVNRPGDAMERFLTVLTMNPGHADAYYYVGKQFLRMKEYDMAWLSAKMAQRLGHKGQDLMKKLNDLSEEPHVVPWKEAGNELFIRQILVDTREKAEKLVSRISKGELFEDIAATELNGRTAEMGGFIGRFDPSDVRPAIAGELLKREVLSEPVIVETEKGYHIVQRLVSFDLNVWKSLIAAYRGSERKPDYHVKAETARKGGSFFVFAGAFKVEKNAINMVRDLRELGFPTYRSQEGDLFSVVVGRFGNYQEALEAGEGLADHGYEYYISPDK